MPKLMRLNGHCGARDAPERLPVLVGPPVARCPVGAGLMDPDVMDLWTKVPGPHGPGTLAGAVKMFPRERAAFEMATVWKKKFDEVHGVR